MRFATTPASLLPALLALASQATAREAGPTVVVEFVVTDGAGAAVRDLETREVVVHQDGVLQQVLGLESEGPGRYVLRYAPTTGAAGAVSLRLLRPRTQARGTDGPELKVRVSAPLQPFEIPLVEALASPEVGGGLDLSCFVLRFEPGPGGRHHTFVAELDLQDVERVPEGPILRAHVALLARIRNAQGRELQRFSLDYPVETKPDETRSLSDKLVWTKHLHLGPGRYQLEVAARDDFGGRTSVQRQSFEALPATPGLSMSSVSILQGGSVLTSEDATTDNPLDHEGTRLVPAIRAVYGHGSPARLNFFVVVYPDPARTEAPELSLEVRKGDELLGRMSVPLPPPSSAPGLGFAGGFDVGGLPPGRYGLRLVAHQGAAVVADGADFDIAPTGPVGTKR